VLTFHSSALSSPFLEGNPLPSSSASAKDKSKESGPGLPRFLIGTVTIIGVALLILNVVLISCYVKRRKRATTNRRVTSSKKNAGESTQRFSKI
jgi:hypothetical protein